MAQYLEARGSHPRKKPRIDLPLSLRGLQQVFSHSADFQTRRVRVLGDGERTVTVCYLLGVVRTERLNDYVLRPLAQDGVLAGCGDGETLARLLEQGVLYAADVKRSHSMDTVARALVDGACALFLPGWDGALVVPIPTEEKRAVGQPDNEPALKGARDSFVETLRTNTAMVRRHLRAPELRVESHLVGRQSLTAVDIVYLDGIGDPEMVRRVRKRLREMDVDGVESAGDLEEYLVDPMTTAFPLIFSTQRPDRFCRGLLDGRVGVLCEGLPMGWLTPGTAELFFQTGQDRAYHWLAASFFSLLRYLCAGVTVVLPGLYIALVTFHPEAIPVKLAWSIAAAKQEVPFSTALEVLLMLLAFEVIQEAGLRLPGPIGATVSILGGLVVGNAAVQARIVSPAVLIAVAAAGVAGYTVPSQDLSNALRLWRFLLTLLAGVGGLYALTLGSGVLVLHLGRLESFGVPWLAHFTAGAGHRRGSPSLVRLPLPWLKWRSSTGAAWNRRNQR